MDPNLFLQDIVISSIDPLSTNILEKTLDYDFFSINGWKQISGTWRSLKMAWRLEKLMSQDAILLSPVSTQEFSASIYFTPIGYQNVSNYVSLIFGWQNLANYNSASLMFDSTGAIYATFTSHVNNQAMIYPAWPGFKTHFKWLSGDSFNLTVVAQNTNTILYINGSQCLSTASISLNKGLLGIENTRFYQTLFTNFKVVSHSIVEYRNVEDYVNYVENGGHLIILNTNGYGYFANKLLNIGNQNITTRVISSTQEIDILSNLTLPVITPKDNSSNIIATYGFSPSSVYTFSKKTLATGEIIYVNIYPVISELELNSNKADLYRLLCDLLTPIHRQLEPFEYSYGEISTFRQISMFGTVDVFSSSLLFPISQVFSNITLEFANGQSTVIPNLTQLALFGYSGFDIISSNLTLCNGNGFYTNLNFGNNATVLPNGNSTLSVSFIIGDGGNIFSKNEIKAITISDDKPISILVWQPTINVQGLTKFNELYSSGELNQRMQTTGQDLAIDGTTAVTICSSDCTHSQVP